ncbi:hypothetical protein OG321_42245 [Streptomyces sp. NBC_00424]|uniref:hypothetical protein n=1 Tax=Streptomyces sp. NBC_00424 TaxID=2903648 RepID=UPI00225A7B1A|nr:hypothetical protein [Streptomyces sp. NBC_00424]MCX5079019.1 hypothetical protein [Streptomyces sp. NBC_00424]
MIHTEERPVTEDSPSRPRTCIRVARTAAALAEAAADEAMYAACRSRSGNTTRLDQIMHAAHKEACQARKFANWTTAWETGDVAEHAVIGYAGGAVDAAIRAQAAAGVEVTAAALRAELERPLTAVELAERENERRRAAAQEEAEQQAATGMDQDNRRHADRNRWFAKGYVPELGWTAGHVRVLEAAADGRLYWRGRQAWRAARPGQWTGGRKISRERTDALYGARFLTAVLQADGTRVLTPSPMGAVALEYARLHPAGLHENDRAAYEARYATVAKRHKRRDDRKAAARRLPPLDPSAMRAYRRPVTLAEQEAAAQESAEQRAATEQWDNEGGHCPDMPTPRPTTTRTTDTRRAREYQTGQVDTAAGAMAGRTDPIRHAPHQQLDLWPRENPGPVRRPRRAPRPSISTRFPHRTHFHAPAAWIEPQLDAAPTGHDTPPPHHTAPHRSADANTGTRHNPRTR